MSSSDADQASIRVSNAMAWNAMNHVNTTVPAVESRFAVVCVLNSQGAPPG